MKKKVFIILAVVFLSALAVFSIVYAFQIGNVDGVWGQIDPGGVTRIDVIGRIGEIGPWGTSPNDTDEVVMRRESDVCIGDSNGSDAFDPADEWDFYTENTTSGLGSHTVTCGTTTGLIISEYYESDDTGGQACAIEIYNGTGSTVDLNNYSVVVYRNGISVNFSEICFLHATLANGDVWVLTNGDSELDSVDDEICGSLEFTGDDVVELRRGNEADATDSRWASGNGDSPSYEQGTYWDQTTGYSNTDENQVRYGEGTTSGFANQSGLGFDGVNNIGTITPGTNPGDPSAPFLLGRLTHYNNPIYRYVDVPRADEHYNNLYQVPINITISGIYCNQATPPVPPNEGSSLTFSYNVILEETPNELSCPYGPSVPYDPNDPSTHCYDLVSVSGNPPTTSFTCPESAGASYEGIWTIELLGFTDNGTNTTCPTTYPGGEVFDFQSGEQQDSSACLWARIAAFDPTAVTFADFFAQPEPDGILVSWGTVSEVNNSGFYLYRSTTTSKPFEPMTTFIPSQAPGSGEGATYEFFDANVQSGMKYFYWLESVDFEDRAVDAYGPAEARAWSKLFLPLIGR